MEKNVTFKNSTSGVIYCRVPQKHVRAAPKSGIVTCGIQIYIFTLTGQIASLDNVFPLVEQHIKAREMTNVFWSSPCKHGQKYAVYLFQLFSDNYHASLSAAAFCSYPFNITLLNFTEEERIKTSRQ